MSKRPLIGVTGPSFGGSAAWLMASLAITRVGGNPCHITPNRRGSLGRLRSRLSGLVVGGGADIHPDLYHGHSVTWSDVIRATAHEATRPASKKRSHLWAPAVFLLRNLLRSRQRSERFDQERDVLEIELLAHAVERNLPILGICRGAQLLNVFFGGSLYADVKEFYEETPMRTVFPRRVIQVEPDSRLLSVVGSRSFRVNALHHQAVKTVGRGLRVVARDASGVIQAIEQSDHPFRIGVQWHPEYIPQHHRQVLLFRALVGEASK